MKIPSKEVFWYEIARNYLHIRDIARFELAVDNHDERSLLGLYTRIRRNPRHVDHSDVLSDDYLLAYDEDRGSNSNEIIIPRLKATSFDMRPMGTSYETRSIDSYTETRYSEGMLIMDRTINLVRLSSTETGRSSSSDQVQGHQRLRIGLDREILIDSVDMKVWCDKRQYIFENIKFSKGLKADKLMQYIIDSDKQRQSSHDILTHVKRLNVNSTAHLPKYISKFKSLSTFEGSVHYEDWKNSIPFFIFDKDIKALVRQGQINQNRLSSISPGCHFITSLSFNIMDLSSESIESLIIALPNITSISFQNGKILSDKHLILMEKHWKQLHSIDFSGSGQVTDVGLLSLSDTIRRYRYMKLQNSFITIDGLLKLLQHSNESLVHLSLSYVFNEDIFIDLISHFKKLRRIQAVTFGQCSDRLLLAISTHCPQLKELCVGDHMSIDSITDQGVEYLSNGCKSIEILMLGSCKGLTYQGFDIISKAYCNTLRELVIPGKVLKGYFKSFCDLNFRHRLIINGEIFDKSSESRFISMTMFQPMASYKL